MKLTMCVWQVERECVEGSCCCEPLSDEDDFDTEVCPHCGSHDLFAEEAPTRQALYCERCGKLVYIEA